MKKLPAAGNAVFFFWMSPSIQFDEIPIQYTNENQEGCAVIVQTPVYKAILDRLFLLNSCAWTGMYFGYAVGKNVDVFYFLPILIIWLVYYTFFIIFIRGKSYC